MKKAEIIKECHLLWTSFDSNGEKHDHYGITVRSLLPPKRGFSQEWNLNCRDLSMRKKGYAEFFGMTEEDYNKLLDTFPKNEDNT
jgi:hypothetical protein